MAPEELDALLAAAAAAAVTAALTPSSGASRGASALLDEPRDRGLSERTTPLLGGIAIFAGVARRRCSIWLPVGRTSRPAILVGRR